jgi:2-polyprenyl-3-methyl-5-hydroxy-6-metoxy-1,4-benzoquinol methylase
MSHGKGTMGCSRARELRCSVCSSDVRRLGNIAPSRRFGAAAHDIVECLRCGLAFSDPLPSDEELRAFYGSADAYCEAYGQEDFQWQRRQHERDVRRIEKRIGRVGRILDVGCSYGLLLDVAAARGWDVWGIEPNEIAANRAAMRAGVRLEHVLVGRLVDMPSEWNGFDAISMSHVFEHFVDPHEAIRRAATALRSGGVLAIQTPNRMCPYVWRHGPDYRPVEHPYYWTFKSLRMAATAAGLIPRFAPHVRPKGEGWRGYAKETAALMEHVTAVTNCGVKSTIEIHAIKP